MIPGTIYRWCDSDLYVMFVTLELGVMIKDDLTFFTGGRVGQLSKWCDCTFSSWIKITW
jgi:hypothetical protein